MKTSTGLSASGPRASDSAGTGQQTVPAPSPGEQNRCCQQTEGDGGEGKSEVGRPPEEGDGRAEETEGEVRGEEGFITGPVCSHFKRKFCLKL